MQRNWLRIGAVSVGMLMANPFSFAQRIFPQPPPPQAQGQMQHWSVNMNDVPQAAQSALYDLAAGQPITQVWMFRRGNFVYYKAQLASGASVHVTPDGRVLYNENFSAPGHRRVDFGDLPHDVKETLRREAGGRPIDRISEVYRNGRTLYLARIEGREHVRMLLINRRGEVVREHGGEHGPWRLEPGREHERR